MSDQLNEVEYISYNKEKADKGIWGQMKRCAFSQEGERIAYHDPNNTNLWEDGTEVDWSEYESNGWNCMVEIPKVYYKIEHGKNHVGIDVTRWEVTGAPKEGFKLHPAFDRPNVKANYVYYSAFEAWTDSEGRMRSLPNKTLQVNETITWFRKSAMKNSHPGYIQQDFLSFSLIQILYMTEYGELNSQKVLGDGGGNKPTGQSLKDGNNSTTGNTKDYMSYRGIENFYANRHKWVDGVNIDNRRWNISHDFTKYSVDSVKPPSYEYVATASSSDGYIKEMHPLEEEYDYGLIPKETGGSSNTHYADYYSQSSGHRILRQGYYSGGASAGFFGLSAISGPSSSYSDFSSRLQCIK